MPPQDELALASVVYVCGGEREEGMVSEVNDANVVIIYVQQPTTRERDVDMI